MVKNSIVFHNISETMHRWMLLALVALLLGIETHANPTLSSQNEIDECQEPEGRKNAFIFEPTSD